MVFVRSSVNRGRWVVDEALVRAPHRSCRGTWLLVAALGLLMVACLGKLVLEVIRTPGTALAQMAGPPVNDPDEPIAGAGADDDCAGADVVPTGGIGLRTHGPDPLLEGAEVADAGDISGAGGSPAIECVGDGEGGNWVQVLYVRPSNVPSRASSVRAGLRDIAVLANRIYRDSAAETGGNRSIRFVHDGSWRPPRTPPPMATATTSER